MRARITIYEIAVLILVFFTTVSSVCAGDLTVTLKEPFNVGGKNYPAGHYRILADSDSDHINLLNLDKRTDDPILFTTRLSPREGQPGEVVFDKTESGLYLSEIYIIGMDGLFFQGAPGKHKHLVVKEGD